MKQLFKPLSILLLVIISALWTSASAVVIDGIYYYLEGNEATVTNKAQNSYSSRNDDYANSYSGVVTIPSTITHDGKTYTVTQIQAYAFYKCPDLKTISIPSTVSSIEIADAKDQASSYFSGDASFKAFIVSTDNPNYTAIGGILFNKDKTTLLKCPQAKTGDFTVPSTVKTFGRFAFEECNSLNSISLPNGITSIGDYVFYNCYSIKNINIPTSLTELGNMVFYGCSSLSEIIIPSGIKKISDFAFCNCSSLTSITIPEGIEEIGNSAFSHCPKLTEVVLPSTVKRIGDTCFRECTNLSKINIPEGITEIQEQTFYKCALTSITLPESVTKIGNYAFWLNKIPIVNLPKSIIHIGQSAFYSYYLLDVYVYNFPYVSSYSNYNSFNINSTLRIHVYPPLVDTYKTNEYWHSYADYIVGDIPIEHPIKNIVLDHTSLAMNSYTEGKLTATIKPDNASVKEVIYTSSNEDVVTIIDNTGIFMTLEAGTATITATALDGSGVKATCKISVSDGITKAESVTLSTTNTTIQLGSTKTLKATVLPENASMRTVTWKSSNPDVATVDENGIVTGIHAGTATITATAADGKGAYAECQVTIIYNSIALTDVSTSYSNDTETIVNTLKYTRTFNSTAWQALYVPFSMEYSDWSKDFEVAAINNLHQYDDDDNGTIDRTELEIVKVKSGSLKPNIPYLIKAKSTGSKTLSINNATLKKTGTISIYCASINTIYTFIGTYSTINGSIMVSNGYYALVNGELVKAEDKTISLNTFRWYLKIENKDGSTYAPGKIALFCLDEDLSTEIDENIVNVENKVVGIYDANGRKLNELKNGLNIVKYSDGSTKKIMK